MKNLILIILFICTCCLPVSAHYIYRLLNTSIGLPDNEIKSQLWLPDGRLCVRTSSSLSFFDGCTFRSFPPVVSEMYPMDYVAALPTAYVDGQQRVWIKESGQMLVFDLTTERYVGDIRGLLASMGIKERIRNLFIDSAKDFWFVTVSGKVFHREGNSKGKAVAVRVRAKGLRDVANWAGNHWFVYCDGKIMCWNAAMTKVLHSQLLWKGEMLARDFVQFSQNSEQLWVMWNHGVASWHSLTHQWQYRYVNDKDVAVTLCAASPKICYVGLRNAGLLALSADGNTMLQSEYEMMNGDVIRDGVQTIAYRDGNLMIGMANHGIFFYNSNMQRFPYVIYQQLGLSDGSVRLNDGKGGKPLAVTSHHVYQLLMPQMQLKPLPVSGTDFIRSMVDSRNRVWVGTFKQGFYMWDGLTTHHFMQGSIPQKDINYNIVREFQEDAHHRIWVSFHGGIGVLDENCRIHPLKDKHLEKYKVVNEFRIDKNDVIWAATSQGFFAYSLKDKKYLSPQDLVDDVEMQNLLSGPCKALLVDSQGWIWVGSLNGVFVLKPSSRKVFHFGLKNGMPNEMINGIIEDQFGNVWVTTANGLCRFSRLDEQNFRLAVFDEQNKLGDCSFNWMATTHLAGGKLLFGSQNGFYVVDPSNIQNLKYSGHPIFTSLFVNEQEILPGRELNGRVVLENALSSTRRVVLRYDENFITVYFSGLNFDMPRHTYYKYRLKGVNADWVESSPQDGIGKVSYTNLAPGEYELEVFTAGFDKKWSQQSIRLLIVIQPPFWATWWAKLCYLLLIGGAIFWVIRRKMMRDRQRMEVEKNKELEDMKYRFFTNITHEFRTLLTLIITPVGSVLKRTTDEETRQQLKGVSKNAGDLLQLVNQLLDFRKMETNGESLNLRSGIFGEFVKYTAMKFQSLADQKQVTLDVDDHSDGLFMCFDRDKVAKILNNLLSNAFKYTPSGGRVGVELSQTACDGRRFVRMEVVDTGCGISPEDQKHVFDRFFRSSDQKTTNVGSGIGLNMVAEYVKLHQGKISLDSKEGEGSRFIVELPADLKTETHVASSNRQTDDSSIQQSAAPAAHQSGDHQFIDKSILVVEDNEGFRQYLVKELSHIYNKVLMAEDGLQGAMMAEEHNPDLIITDVMMPRMSGTEMCRRIKENLQTSHIPVILLTAWSTDEGRAEGYKVGADAYIAKPFDMDVLLARISNLLEKQEKRMHDFSHSASLDVRNIADSAPDEKFLKEIISLIEKNITDSDYTTDSLAADMAMSRMSLYRKMKALTGQTPSDFIRTVRLKAAAELLKSGQRNVSEVCYLTGFATPQNFTKHFKDMFGVVPSQYRG
nr:hybrid sensor histidine kinase/response regulator transcription factor [Prevotella sp.]